MKTFITRNAEAKTGYAIVTKEDDGNIVDIMLINEYDPSNPKSLKLPENPSNRKYFSIEKIGDEVELTYKETKVLGPRGNSKKIEDYITDEEKAIITDIMAKAKARKEADKPRELTPVEKAQLKIEKAKKELEKLLAEEAKA